MRSDAQRLGDILTAAEDAVRFARPRSRLHTEDDVRVDSENVWGTVEVELPGLISQLRAMHLDTTESD